jgi:TolB-like protein/class 3 adenylate cyclase/Flp pilus assembly protein TadD
MSETRKLAAILVTDVVGYSRLAGTDEERTLSRLRGLRSDLIDPAIAVHHGRVVKRTGDGSIVEFRSVVDAVRCAIEVQNGMIERNAGLPPERQIQNRIGIHVGDVVEESDGDLMGDGVNIAARLEGIAAPGAICLSEDAYRQVKARLEITVSDLGEVRLKNIVESIRVYSLEVGQPAQTNPALQSHAPASVPPRLSIVVLPFTNIGGDQEQEYFVDGVTESLTTDLSRISGSFVIARNTAYSYKGRAFDVTNIGRELNVRYALEGSVQRGANRMRVNVQLINAESGSHLWAERFEKPVTDLFEMQDEIVARIANTLNAQLIAVEARRADRAPTPDSMDLYFQGEAWVNRGITFENMTKARGFFERALALDAQNVDALVGISQVDANVAVSLSTSDRAARFAAAEAAAAEALSLAPDHAVAHLCMGMVLGFTNRAVQSIAELDRALALDRNLAGAHALIGQSKLLIGRGEETEAHVQEALRLSPRDPWAYTFFVIVGFAKSLLGRPEEAISWLRRSIESNRNYSLSHFTLAAALANVGRMGEARSEVGIGLALDPQFTIANFCASAWSDNPVYLAQRTNIIEGIRKAGVLEE